MPIDTRMLGSGTTLERKTCANCNKVFVQTQPWQKVCANWKCKQARQNQREARSAWLTRISRRHGPSHEAILRVWAVQGGFCPWCRTKMPVHPQTLIPRAKWLALSVTRGIFLCVPCGTRFERLQRLVSAKALKSPKETIDRVLGLLEGIDGVWRDVRRSRRDDADSRRRARFAARLEAIAGNGAPDGADLR